MKTAVKTRYLIGILLAIGIIAWAVSAVSRPAPAQALSGACNLSGYAWSDTIGWISMSCQNDGSCSRSSYGLSMDGSGNITGYAWSDNIGWIQAGGSGCPGGGSCAAGISSGNAYGWLKAVAGGSSQSGGWDGWISLSGTSPAYGVTEDASGNFSGWAWGDTNVGWISFSGVSCIATATCGSGQYSQNGQCVASCSVGYTPGTDQNGNPVCSFTGCPTGYNHVGNQCVFSACPVGYTQSTQNGQQICTFSVNGCPSGYTEQQSPSGPQCVILSLPPTQPPQGYLVAVPTVLKSGSVSNVSWSAQNVSSCTVSGSNGDGLGGNSSGTWSCSAQADCAATSTRTTSTITGLTSYTLTCTGLNSSTFTQSVNVSIVPNFNEQ